MKENKSKEKLSELVENYKIAHNRLLLLDFDGTLIDLQINPDDAIPSRELLKVLITLSEDPKNKLFIITGRHKDDIDKRLGHIPVSIIAEHGALIKENSEWEVLLGESVEWKKRIMPIFVEFTAGCPNSYIEEKLHSIAWHYRRVDPETGIRHSRKLIESLEKISLAQGVKVLDGKLAVEITNANINKGKATEYILKKYTCDYILSIGDDMPDEDMFEVLKDISDACTIKVGIDKSHARYRLKNVQEVIHFLKQLV